MSSLSEKASSLPTDTEAEDPKPSSTSAALTVGGIAALLAGACCLGPFVLISIGFGGAWLANFQLLESYRPLFIAIALIALGFAGWRIFRPAVACEPGAVCAVPRVRRGYRVGFWMVAVLLILTLTFPYYASLLY